jgi:branched-chain amino acid transport system ATP-binding protein
VLRSPAAYLSYGSKKRLELAMAMAGLPAATEGLMLLDEPAAGVPSMESGRILQALDVLPKDIAILMIEHDMDIALGLADRVSVLHQGEMIIEGSAQEVQMHPQVREVYFGKV